ncbi:hypothetical protein [uncultured Corynebacterium sp.]|uniref:hypothetical protein n=1 Tax=uncultured Corynebacterium sp. TaxID=159447 RepID=UPI0025D32181|nr:hypothetical protein [uncultured Corynebacterium sp.]
MNDFWASSKTGLVGVAGSLVAVMALLAGCADDGGDAQTDSVDAGAAASGEDGGEATPDRAKPKPTLDNGTVVDPGGADRRSGDAEGSSDSDGGDNRGSGAGREAPRGGANGAIPSDPTPARTVKPISGGTAVFTTPSGNISCGIDSSGLRCGVASYNDDVPYGEAEVGGPIDTITIRDGEASMYASSDVPPWAKGVSDPGDTMDPQVVGYGEAISYADFVCLSEQAGLTCWDTASGAGAFMSREKTDLF